MYNHTQKGTLILVILVIITAYFTYILTLTGINFPIIAIMLFILLILASFSTLNVNIDHQHLRIRFGYGIFRKKFLLKDIVSVKTVKNHWYYGWGIRYWFPRRMWIFNVSGFDAVELKINNKTYRIGTDEPKKLERAITSGN